MGKRQQRKRKDNRNKPDLEAPASAAATARPGPLKPGGPREKFCHCAHQHNQYSSQTKEFTCGEIETEFDLRPLRESCIVILNNILTVLFFVFKVALKILAFLLFLFRTLVLLFVVVAVILFGLFSITFAAYHTIVEILKDVIPEQFIHPFQVISNIILTVVPPLVEPTIRYILAPIQYFATGDREKYDTIINGLNEINEELFLHEHLGLEQDDHQLDNLNEADDNIAFADSSEIESDFGEDGDNLDYIDSEAEIVFGQPEFCPSCGNHSFLEEDSAADSLEGSIPDFNFLDLLKGSKKMDLVDNLITDEILKNFKDVYMHPECGLRVRSFIRYDGRVAEYSYCLNDKFGDRVIFKNRENPQYAYVEFKPCSILHATPPQPSLEDPLLRLARPPDIPLLMQQSRSYDAHLRYHGIEQMYLLFLRHDLRDMLEEVGLMDVCLDTLARKHADARTRHLCTLILKEMLANNILLCKLTQSWFGQLNKSSPKEYLKKGTGKLNKLLAPYKVFGKSASERYVTAYDLWSASIEKVLALPWKEQMLPLPHKKNVMKNLAQGIRVCKMGSTDAAKAKSGKDEKKNPSHIFGEMAAEVLKESADNLDAHLVAVFCEELKNEFEKAVEKTDVALDLFPDDPWVLVLRAQSTQNIRCCDDTDQHVVNAMTVAWHALQKEGIYTIECYETFLYSLFAESQYSLAYDVAIEAIEKVPIDDKRYANLAYMLAILHLSDLYHLDRAADPNRLDPIKGFVKYYKLGLKSHEFYEEIWQGMQECRYGGQASKTAEYLKKFMMFPIEMRTLMNNVPYYCHKVRAGNEGNVEGRMKQCNVCGVPEVERVLRKCSRCRVIHYCSVGCQQKDWPQHKTNCKKT